MVGDERTTDAVLLVRLREGETADVRREAYAELYERYSLHSIVLAHARAPADRDDVAQEVWEKIWENPPVINVGFEGWLRVAIRRTANRHTKKRSRTATLDGEPSDHATSATREIARREAVEMVVQARREGRITTNQYNAIIDSVSDDTTSEEMATARGLSRTGLCDRLRRGIAGVRRFARW